MKTIMEIIKRYKHNDVANTANSLTYKILLALFPFIIFLLTLIAYFNLNPKMLEVESIGVINTFIDEIVTTRNFNLLSVSLIVSIYSSAGGFEALIRSLNKINARRNSYGFIVMKIMSVLCVIVFAIAIVISFALIIVGDKLLDMLKIHDVWINALRYSFAIFILIILISLLYKISCREKIKAIYRGAVFSAFGWFIMSILFNFYINNFARFSVVYGSIGGVFVLMLWLNININIILIGAELNAIKKTATKK